MLCQNLYITLTIILSIIFRCHPHFADDKTSSENWNHFSLKDTAASHSDEAPDPLPNFNRMFLPVSFMIFTTYYFINKFLEIHLLFLQK